MFAPEISVPFGDKLLTLGEVTPESMRHCPHNLDNQIGNNLPHHFRDSVKDLLAQRTESEAYAQLRDDPAQLVWGIHSRERGGLVGLAGLKHDTRTYEPLPDGWRQVEGFLTLFRSEDQGQRIASAVSPYRTALAFAVGCDVLRLSVHRDNGRANRVAKKAGFLDLGEFFEQADWHNDYRLYSPQLEPDVILQHTLSLQRRFKDSAANMQKSIAASTQNLSASSAYYRLARTAKNDQTLSFITGALRK